MDAESRRSQVVKAIGSDMYLAQFGYLPAQMTNPNSGHLMTQEAMADAIREFQAFAGLNVTECAGKFVKSTAHYHSSKEIASLW
uniref:PG_binding_1 domain-containing protein n=1 Tax=Rhodnius prolixus TaxID=13249 RepID=T1H882_RHOPR